MDDRHRIREPREERGLLDGGIATTDDAAVVAADDEAFTYNKRVNRLAPIQEHYMIVRAIERGVSMQKLARALNERGVPTPTGSGAWTHTTATRVVAKVAPTSAPARCQADGADTAMPNARVRGATHNQHKLGAWGAEPEGRKVDRRRCRRAPAPGLA